MAHRGVVPLLTAVTNDLTAGLGDQFTPGARAVGRHLTLVPPPTRRPAAGPEDADAVPLSMVRAALRQLDCRLEELARRQGQRPLTTV